MLPHVFSRVFSQYRDPAFITGRFQFATAGSLWSQITTNRQTTYGAMNVVSRGTGLGTLTFPASRNAVIVDGHIEPLGDAIANLFDVKFKLLNSTTGTVDFVICNESSAIAAPTNLSILVISMYVAR